MLVQIGLLRSLRSTLTKLDKRKICGNTWLAFSKPEAFLTFVGSKTLDVMFIPKWGLDIATEDKFAKINNIKTTNNDKHQQLDTNKTQMTKKNIYNIPR